MSQLLDFGIQWDKNTKPFPTPPVLPEELLLYPMAENPQAAQYSKPPAYTRLNDVQKCNHPGLLPSRSHVNRGHRNALNPKCNRKPKPSQSYPDPLAIDPKHESAKSTSFQTLEPLRPPPSNGSIIHNNEEHHLIGATTNILNMLICPTADSSCRDFSAVIRISIHEPWIKDAMLAFTSSVMSPHSPNLRNQAPQLYQLAIMGLRNNFTDVKDKSKLQMLMVSASFLGLLETLCSAEPHRPMVHFAATAKLLSLLKLKSPWNMSSSSHTLYRIMVEDTVYNLAVLSLFYEDLDTLAGNVCWEDLESFFPLKVSPDGTQSHTSHYSTSPFLGGRRDLYYLMFNLIRFSRQQKTPTEKAQKIRLFREKLRVIEDGIKSYYDDDVPPQVAQLYGNKYKLHVLSLRIIIAKVEDPTRCSSSPEIQDLVNESLVLMMMNDLKETANPAICWPLTILAFAVETEENFNLIKRTANSIKESFDKGHGDRLMRAINLVGRHRKNGSIFCPKRLGVPCIVDHDGLGLLLRQHGPFKST
ncbi:hypothetical protein BP6252_06583 [Coleophoma cylindrospora]|uniref:Uncharacterized protein n=1 Tax=Coleophoma cylindrospora TaxID=1849047 RepID=A0A3D8RNQ4_9HELO|nr:hypothetical protein BP6252_06583 [Coleophoma cylindrospora]